MFLFTIYSTLILCSCYLVLQGSAQGTLNNVSIQYCTVDYVIVIMTPFRGEIGRWYELLSGESRNHGTEQICQRLCSALWS